MTKKEYKECIYAEVYKPFEDVVKHKLSLVEKLRCLFFSPQLNAGYLVRKMLYLNSMGGSKKLISQLLHLVLVRRYGMFVSPNAIIGKGLKLYHPTSIVVTNAIIGDNFTIFQGCTIGQKYAGQDGYGKVPTIGNNVTMYANSSIIGDIKVVDNVVLAAHSCLLHDALKSGIYAGCPAKLIKEFTR